MIFRPIERWIAGIRAPLKIKLQFGFLLVIGVLLLTGVVSLLSLATLHQVGTAAGADTASLLTAGASLVATYNATFLIGQTLMPATNALLLGYLMYRSGLVPRIIPTLGLIGGPLMISSVIGQAIGINEQISVWSGIALLPIFAWEFSLGLWLVFKGFRPSPITSGDTRPVGMSPAAVAAG